MGSPLSVLKSLVRLRLTNGNASIVIVVLTRRSPPSWPDHPFRKAVKWRITTRFEKQEGCCCYLNRAPKAIGSTGSCKSSWSKGIHQPAVVVIIIIILNSRSALISDQWFVSGTVLRSPSSCPLRKKHLKGSNLLILAERGSNWLLLVGVATFVYVDFWERAISLKNLWTHTYTIMKHSIKLFVVSAEMSACDPLAWSFSLSVRRQLEGAPLSYPTGCQHY